MTDLQTMIDIMTAFRDGKSIRFRPKEADLEDDWEWSNIIDKQSELQVVWNWEYYTYEIVSIKPSIDWTAVSPNYKFLAVDRNGDGWLYTQCPTANNDTWAYEFSSHADVSNAKIFSSFDRGDCDWKDSLIVRPDDEIEDQQDVPNTPHQWPWPV